MLAYRFLTALGLIVVVGCSPPVTDSSPTKPIAQADVVGTWELRYDGKVIFDEAMKTSVDGFGTETLILKNDGTYQQTFNDNKGGTYPITFSTWKMVKNHQGQDLISLTVMRFYPSGLTAATSNPPPAETRLLVQTSSNLPFGGMKCLILCFEYADLNLCFNRIKTAGKEVK
jgi:hypothetical protein